MVEVEIKYRGRRQVEHGCAGCAEERQLDAATRGIERLHHPPPDLSLADHFFGGPGHGVGQTGEWHIAACSPGADVHPVAGIGIHLAIEFGPQLVLRDEGDERQRFIHRLEGAFGPTTLSPAAPALLLSSAPLIRRQHVCRPGVGIEVGIHSRRGTFGALSPLTVTLATLAAISVRVHAHGRRFGPSSQERGGRLGHRHGLHGVGGADTHDGAFGLTNCLTTFGTTYRRAVHEDPPQPWHRFAADEATPVEEPVVGAVELLEGVVGEDGGAQFVGHLENEAVAPTNGAGRGHDDFAFEIRRFERWLFGSADPVGEGGIDDDQDISARVFFHEALNRFVELVQTGKGTTLGCDVRSVDHDFVRGHRFLVFCCLFRCQWERCAPAAPPARHAIHSGWR